MISPRWKKILKDIVGYKLRTLLVILTIGVGVYAIGIINSSLEYIMTDMEADYQSSNPHDAMIFSDPFDDDLLFNLRRVEGVADLDARGGTSVTIHLPQGEKAQADVIGLPALDEIRVDLLSPEDPEQIPPLGKQEVYIEFSGAQALKIKRGDTLDLTLPDGYRRQVRVAAIIRDVNAIPYVFGLQVTLYANLETIGWLGGTQDYTRLLLAVTGDPRDEAHVEDVSARLAEKIEESGKSVYFTRIFRPGRHFASDITQSLGIFLTFLGGLSVFLGAFLIINSIYALLTQQVRQIGVMKAIGATQGQLIWMYVLMLVLFGVLSLVIAIPLSASHGYATARGTAEYLNFRISEFHLSRSTIQLQVLVAIGVPVLAGIVPILRATQTTIREALSSYGIQAGKFGNNVIDRLVEMVRFLPRPLLISLRNTFRRKARLVLTLSGLTLAGAMFLSVMNLRGSMNLAIDDALGYLLSDVNVSFAGYYRMDELEPWLENIPEIDYYESWGIQTADLLVPGDLVSTQVLIFAPPAGSRMIEPTLTSGRWLLPGDKNGIVIGNHLLAARPDLKVGDEIIIKFSNGKESRWRIVGTFIMAGNVSPPIVYSNAEDLAAALGQVNRVSQLRIQTKAHDPVTQQRVADALERAFEEADIQVAQVLTGTLVTRQNTAQIDLLVIFMVVMAGLLALVGGLGLASTMSMNVIERTREIGVIRAIGAANSDVMQLVIVEGVLIGLISFLLAAVFAIPIGLVLTNLIGIAILQTPLNFVVAYEGYLIWVTVVVVLSALASYAPARSAAKLTVREILAYE